MAAVVTLPWSFASAARPLARSPRAAGARTLAIVQSLPESVRRAVTLRFVYGLPQAEVASRLGITESEVGRLLAQAVRAVAGEGERRFG